MLKRTVFIQLLLIALFACSPAAADKLPDKRPAPGGKSLQKQAALSVAEAEHKDYAPGQVLVKFKEGIDSEALMKIQSEMHLAIIKVVHKPDIFLLKILDNAPVENVIERLQKYEEVIYAEPNYIRRAN